VDSAEAFCRSTTPREAVDVFWLRDPAERIGRADVEVFAQILNDVLHGERAEPTPPLIAEPPSSRRNTTVRFLEQADGALSVLEVETEDRTGLLWAISRALHSQGVQILASQIRTEGTRVLDRFSIAELDESPISSERRFMIQVAILSILE
jgi:UTP:GlnB (protein PII) uridylyltransferase